MRATGFDQGPQCGHWPRVIVCSFILAIALAALPAGPAVAGPPTSFQKVWAFELTDEGNEGLTFVNPTALPCDITVYVYEPDGDLEMTVQMTGTNPTQPQFSRMEPYESRTVFPGVATNSGGWGLPKTNHGSPATDTVYGMIATSRQFFSIMVYPDQLLSGFGNANPAIWAQNTVTEASWGHYNPPAVECNENGREYFYVVNPGDATANISVELYDTDGDAIGSNPRTFSVGSKQTRAVYLEDDLASSPGTNCDNMGYPGPNQNISLHLTSSQPVNVSVVTSLGNDWDTDNDRYKAHGNRCGMYVAYEPGCFESRYTWSEALNGAATTAARVTNPNSYPITVRQTFYPDDGNPSSYVQETTVPARGTKELPPPDNYEGDWKDEAISQSYSVGRHYFTLQSIDDPGNPDDAIGDFHAHVSFETQIDWPSTWKTDWFWGSYSSGQTNEVFLINPYDDNLEIFVEYAADPYGAGSLVPGQAGGTPIVLPPGQSLEYQLPSNFIAPNTAPPIPSSLTDATLHFFSARPFPICLELTYGGGYGDLVPWDCGTGSATEFGDAPDSYQTLDDSDGPEHTVSADIYLGVEVDVDNDGQPNTAAKGDDDAGVPDDEDGVTFEVSTTQVVATVTAFNNTGSTVYLVGWVDLDGNGSFDDSERLAVAVPSSASPQQFVLTFTAPEGTSVPDYTYARFRIGSEISSDPATQLRSGYSGIGEVEDYILQQHPTAVELARFGAKAGLRHIDLYWETAQEVDQLGFHLYRATEVYGPRTRVNEDLIPSRVPPGSSLGTSYSFVDWKVRPNRTYYYWLEDVDIYGRSELHGPVEVRLEWVLPGRYLAVPENADLMPPVGPAQDPALD